MTHKQGVVIIFLLFINLFLTSWFYYKSQVERSAILFNQEKIISMSDTLAVRQSIIYSLVYDMKEVKDVIETLKTKTK